MDEKGKVVGALGESVAVVKEPEMGQLPQTRKKRCLSKATIVIIIFGAITLGLAGFLIWHFCVFEHGEKQCEEQACEVVEIEDEETGEVVKIIKVPVGQSDEDVAVRKVADKMYEIAVERSCPNGGGGNCTVVKSYNEGNLLYKPEGLKTHIGLNLSYGFKIVWDGVSSVSQQKMEQIDAMDNDVRRALLDSGFREYGESFIGIHSEYIDERAGIICGMNGGLPYDFVCSSTNWYDVDVEQWDLLNELAEAYKEKRGDYPITLGVSTDRIVDSGYEKYQKLIGSVSNAMGFFYRVSPESEWRFFTATQAALSCSEYNTDDLRRAFMGEACWNEETQAKDVVKP